jgi:hypothetical protein
VFRAIQFPFRLTSYLELVAAVGAIVALKGLTRPRLRGLVVGALVLAVGVQLGGAIWSSWKAESAGTFGQGSFKRDLRAGVEPRSFTDLTEHQFRVFETIEQVAPNTPLAKLRQPHPVTDDTGIVSGTGRVGDIQIVPVVWSQFTRITGDAKIAGNGPVGLFLVSVTHTDARGRWSARVEATHPWQLVVGRIISVGSAAACAALAFAALRRRRRRRGSEETIIEAVEPPAREPAPAG